MVTQAQRSAAESAADGDAVRGQIVAQHFFIVASDREADMIDISPGAPWRHTAGAPELALDGDEIDQRA